MMMNSPSFASKLLVVVLLLATASAASAQSPDSPSASSEDEAPTQEPETLSTEQLEQILVPIPSPDLTPLEAAVRDVIKLRQQGLQVEVASGQVTRIVEAYGEIGFLYHAHNLWPAALVAYRNAEVLAPKDPRWSYASALAFRESNQIDAAASAYQRSLDILPRNPAAIVSLAEIRLEQNQPEWAKALLRFALEVTAESPAALAVMGQVALSQKRHADAVSFLERSLNQQPAATRLHYPLALAYRGLGEIEKAKEHLALRGEVGVRPPDPIQALIDERKTGERVMLLEGRRAFSAGHYAAAAALFQQALDAEPESVRARVNLASARAMNGEPEVAISIYQEVLELDQENAAALFNLGLLLIQSGQIQDGIPLLERSAAADPDDAEVRLQLARALAGEGRLEAALRWASEASRVQPANQSTWLLAANVEKALGRWREARERLENAHRQMPDAGLLIHDLARLLAASPDATQRDGERAVQLAASVANSAPTPLHLETMALALGEAARCPEAAEAQRLAAERSTDVAVAERLRSQIERYETTPCRPPFGGGS